MTKESQELEGSFLSALGDKVHVYYKHFVFGEITEDSIHLVFQHGLLEYHGRHLEFIQFVGKNFSKNGIIISCLDLVGHGLSGGNRTYIKSFSNYDEDFGNFLDLCKVKFQCRHFFLMGHSLGGLIVLKKVLEMDRLGKKLSGVILVNPAIGVSKEIPRINDTHLKKLQGWFGKLRIPVNNAKDLTHDIIKAREFVSDHLISNSVTINTGIEIFSETEKISFSSYFLSSPCLFILSGLDKIVDNEKTELYITSMNKKYVKMVKYPKMYHDILNEVNRKEVYKTINEYISERISNAG